MGSHYTWAAKGVQGDDPGQFAARLEQTLNKLEDDDFEIYDVMDAPTAPRGRGVVVIGKKPRRFPSNNNHVPTVPPPTARTEGGSVTLDPARMKGRR